MAKVAAQLTAGDRLVARSQNTFCALFLSELKDINTESNRRNSAKIFTKIPLQIWEFHLLDEFLNSTALVVRRKVTGLELRALRTARSHKYPFIHPSLLLDSLLIKQHRVPKALMYRPTGGGAGVPIFPQNSQNLTCQGTHFGAVEQVQPSWWAGLEMWCRSTHKNPACPSCENFSVAQKSFLGWV